MDRSKGILLWVAGFAGVLLLYAAYKDKSPLSILTNYAGNVDGGQTDSVTRAATVAAVPITPNVQYQYTDAGTVDIPSTYAQSPETFIAHSALPME